MNVRSLSIVVCATLGIVSARGPEPGAKIPDFALTDQSGAVRTFAGIRGPKGAMLVFYRSADW